MEILGSTFDDSVFEEARDKVCIPLPSYTAKVCEPEWFCERVTTEDELETQKVFKFRADLAYSRKEYQKSLDDYSTCLSLVPEGNLTIRRDILEGQARCYCYLGMRDQALEVIDKLRKEATNTCHLTCVLNLELTLHRHFGDLSKEVRILQQLVSLHPYNPWHWKSLAGDYLRLFRSHLAVSCSGVCLCGDGREQGGDREGAQTLPEGTAQNSRGGPEQLVEDGEHRSGLDLVQQDIAGIHRTREWISTAVQDQCKERERAWLQACMCFIRTRLLLRMLRVQQSSFVLQRNREALQEVEEALECLEPKEAMLQLITEAMGRDLVAERMREDSQDGESLAGLCISDFEERWYNSVESAVLQARSE
ncbi:uncharacterized protein C8orf76 [Megalops cyprinoides]|uniref:uncharacterized protein C8orf76 n=1 Tax=Megalops cyprinoides TaxID=118141 RepID=UPI0018641C9E|nr:uncharacterized protein C8orf76 [Megalops cyprinoides]